MVLADIQVLLPLDPEHHYPLHRQLYFALQKAILNNQLPAGTRLPGTRALAQSLQVSRNTVIEAYAQLESEGYLDSQHGSGTYVGTLIPEQTKPTHAKPTPETGRRISERGERTRHTPVSLARNTSQFKAFRPSIPDFESFPFSTWSRLIQRHWQQAKPELLSYGPAAGYRPLRESIAKYLGASRGVRCTADQVIIVSGSQQGIDLAARVLLDPGDRVWFEDPGYLGARGALISAGVEICPVSIDDEGLNISEAQAKYPQARLAYITPSHQYPLGVTMSLARRLALIEWSQQQQAWILEDDYDGEFRYTGRTLSSLQGLDTQQRTIYLGTLSKTMFPTLRLGYLVVPLDLVDAFQSAKALIDRHAPQIEQAVLHEFIEEGHMARHIRRVRSLYDQRRQRLIELLKQKLGSLIEIGASEAGMHMVVWLPQGIDDQRVMQAAAAQHIDAPAISCYAIRKLSRGGLLLGYSSVAVEEMEEAVDRLAIAIKQVIAAST
jgi:GntR family transcriptional regulator/MocR family aminotransferase